MAPDFSEYEKALQQVGCEIKHWEWMRGDCTIGKTLPKGSQIEVTECGKIQIGLVPASDLSDYILIEDIDMIILSNPNNPSGCLHSPDFLRELAAKCERRQILLVVDECFMDFVDSAHTYSLLEFVANCRNLIVIRAFTKFYGMAGLRLGWCATSNADLIAGMKKAGPPWSVSIPAQAAGIAVLSEEAYADRLRGYISAECQQLQSGLQGLGFQVISGAANYILFYSERTDLARLLLERGIAIRDCSNYVGLGPGWYRVAVRLREENERLLREIAFLLR